MRRSLVAVIMLFLLLIVTQAWAGVLDATWTAPTTNTDGTALTDLAAYRVYYSQTSPPCPGSQFLLVNSPTSTPAPNTTITGNLTGLTDLALYFVAVTAVDTTGNESDCSSVASANARVAQGTPPPNPGTPQIGTMIAGATTVTIPVSWTASIDPVTGLPVPSYPYNAAYNDGSSPVTGIASTTSINLVMNYHSSGLATGAFICVKAKSAAGLLSPDPTGMCQGYTVPAKPVAGTGGFTVTGLVANQTVSGLLRVSAAPNAGVSAVGASFTMKNSAGAIVSSNPEGGVPYCFVGDNGALPCLPFDTTTVPNGAYTMTVTMDTTPSSPNQVIPFTVSNNVTPTTFTLTVAKGGTGTGQVTGAGTYPVNTAVTVTATADASSYFSGWLGACTGAIPTCSVTMSADKSTTAVFTLKTFTLTSSVVGSGTITASPLPVGGVYNYNTVVTLTATPAVGNQFSAWSGDCTGTGTCTLTMLGNKVVAATFAVIPPQQFALTMLTTGNGTITASPSGGIYTAGTVVNLTATPAVGSQFSGWSGACTGTGACSVTMDAAKTVTAAFTLIPPQQFTLTTSVVGSGTVAANPPGGTYTAGTLVTLTATASAGFQFSGWSGACSGTGACTVTMTANQAVTATFTAVTIGATVVAKQNTCAETFTINNAPASTTSVRLYRNGSPDGSLDKSVPFVFNRNLPAGTTDAPFIYVFKADLTPSGTQRTFTPEITISCP